MKSEKKVKMGKSSRARGKAFELKVRKHLESQGWIVVRWDKNVEFNPGEIAGVKVSFPRLINSKPKFNPFTHSLMMNSSGFPDFICFKSFDGLWKGDWAYTIIGVECKTNGKLDKIEKEKCQWLLRNKIFNKILLISPAGTKGRDIYEEEITIND